MIEEEEKLSGREDSSDLSLGEVEQLAVPAGIDGIVAAGGAVERVEFENGAVGYLKGSRPPQAVTVEQVERAATMTDRVLLAIRIRRQVQDANEGSFRDYADGTGRTGAGAHTDRQMLMAAYQSLAEAKKAVKLSWRHQLDVAVAELYVERDPKKLRRLLVEVAAITVAWAEGIEVRASERRIAEQQQARKLVLLPGGGTKLVLIAPWWRRALRWLRLIS